MSDTALRHIEHLSVAIGPRGSTSAQEKAGHAYAQQVLAGLGLAPRLEPFQWVGSPYLTFGLGLGLALAAEAIYWLTAGGPNPGAGALAAAAFGLLGLVSALLESSGVDNPLRWFTPAEGSQNVVAVAPAAGPARRRLALVAHVDTHRTPLFWHSPAAFTAYRVLSVLSTLSLAALCVIFGIGVFAPSAALRTASLLPAAVVLVMWALIVHAHFTPFTAGANDNASGVGVVLALAERLKAEPLTDTEVWIAITGCEEAGAGGSADFVGRHGQQLDGFISVDNIAGVGTGPVYLRSEGIVIPKTYSGPLLDLAERLAQARPELGARPVHQRGAYTDGLPALSAGLPALSFVGYTAPGWIPNWHHPNDVFGNVDADAVERTEQFVWALLRENDK
jgi:hypothetical protein